MLTKVEVNKKIRAKLTQVTKYPQISKRRSNSTKANAPAKSQGAV